MRSFVSTLLVGAALGLCVPAGAQESSSAALTPLAHRGFVTERTTAERAVAFRPFVPDRQPIQVALLPPFHGGQVSANEGIAYAYGRRGRTWILSEWPRNGGTLSAFAPFPTAREPRCDDVHAVGGSERPRGVAWSTPRGIVLTLTPDGSADPRTLVTEWHRLVRRGACR
ncbi:MAG TPA: hypothetical protein VMA36_11170 [Candidatus Limnocylindria bacterium]|jgi:hypothetical protein|nr:hypothetical protein [Candidatus Limnocylindria bacterium]